MANIIKNYIERNNHKPIAHHDPAICIICSSSSNLTKEHVIPRWAFNNCPNKYFITDVNGQRQTYNKTTIPACRDCNTNLLSNLERYISQLFTNSDFSNNYFAVQDLENIIRWLEIIDYKFQVLNVRRKFVRSKVSGYISYLADFPISLLRMNKNYTPSKVVSEIRHSLKRITIKAKFQHINSLVIFKTSNPDFHFLHTMNEFIFLELPYQKVALFYFYSKTFSDIKDARDEAMKIIHTVY